MRQQPPMKKTFTLSFLLAAFVTFGQKRVGINVIDPQQTLDVGGTAQAQLFTYATPQTHYLTIPADAFTSDSPGIYQLARLVSATVSGDHATGTWLVNGSAGQYGYVSAPVSLPQGATITGFTIIAQDNDGVSLNPRATLSALAPIAGSPNLAQGLAATVSLAAKSQNLQTLTIPVNHIVQNDVYAYKVTVRLNQNSNKTTLFAVRITYTVTQPG